LYCDIGDTLHFLEMYGRFDTLKSYNFETLNHGNQQGVNVSQPYSEPPP
jgi:hypothetical protein